MGELGPVLAIFVDAYLGLAKEVPCFGAGRVSAALKAMRKL